MSDNKNDKDSYAQDTLAFSVPDESAKRKNAYPQNAYPQSNRPQRQKYPEQYPQEQYQYEQYPEGHSAEILSSVWGMRFPADTTAIS